jgi:hypothetical protein
LPTCETQSDALHTLAAHGDKVLCVGWGGLDGKTILSGGADAQLLAHALPAAAN